MGTADLRVAYLSGPITGLDERDVAAAFFDASVRWSARGYVTINPAERFGGRMDLPREAYMRFDLAELLHADAIVLLPGWEGSRGARTEKLVAEEIGLEVLYDDGE